MTFNPLALRRLRLDLLEREALDDRAQRTITHRTGLRSLLVAEKPDDLDKLELAVRRLHQERRIGTRRSGSTPAGGAAVAEAREAAAAGRFVGRAVEYGSTSELLYGHFREKLRSGCFDKSLARKDRDLICVAHHDPNALLGRESAGTLRVSPDATGISVDCAHSGYSYGDDLAAALRAGDLRGMSFVFDVTGDQWEYRDNVPLRTVTEADIWEVSFVWYPAYSVTTAGLR